MATRHLAVDWLTTLPLDAEAAVDAVMNSGIAELIQFVMLMLAVVLTAGALLMFGLAGVAYMSTSGGSQYEASDLALGGFVGIGAAMLVGAGPAVLQALGMETAKHFDAFQVFSGAILLVP